MGLDTTRCVVLNATYEPITIVSSKRALILFLEGKAMIVEEHPELVVRSPSQTFPVPTSIVLKHFVKGRMVFRTKALQTTTQILRIPHTGPRTPASYWGPGYLGKRGHLL